MKGLTPYRRHASSCPHKNKGQGFTTCDCAIWAYGSLNGKTERFSLNTRDWSRAVKRIDAMENPKSQAAVPDGPAITEALEEYKADLQTRNIADSTIDVYERLITSLAQFTGDKEVNEVTVDMLASFRKSRDVAPGTHRKDLVTLRAFFGWCQSRKWCTENPAKGLKPPKETRLPTLPFEQSEIDTLLAAIPKLKNNNKAEAVRARLRAKAMILTAVYTGLRIGDIAQLERKALNTNTGHLTLRTEKTGVPLKLKLHADAMQALLDLPVEDQRYFFLKTGRDPRELTAVFRRTLGKLAKLAKVTDVHPHRFRDTFACRLLEKGTDIRVVQKLLGHESVRTTEKHYAPFVKSHQVLLDQATAALDFTVPPKPKVVPIGGTAGA